MKNPVLRQLEYNLWANMKMADWVGALSESQFEAKTMNSFPSIKTTIYHNYKAEIGWLNRINAIPHPFPRMPEGISKSAILTQWISQSEILLKHGAGLTPEDWQKVFAFTDGYGPEIQYTQEALIQHVCNHSTYHRGQLITMGYQLGLEHFPPNDFILFLRENQHRTDL